MLAIACFFWVNNFKQYKINNNKILYTTINLLYINSYF